MFRKVFISYAKEDFDYALTLYNYLKGHSYEPWLDKKSLLPGSNWDLEIKRALKSSDFIILLLSSTSVSKRGFVQKEYKIAMQYWEQRLEDDIYIIPILINECQVPESLSRFQWIRYEENTFPSIVFSLEAQRNILKKNIKEDQLQQQFRITLDSLDRHEFSAYDIAIVTHLSQGIRQKDIPQILQSKNIKPSGLSSVEKRLNLMRCAYSLSNNEQLVAYCKNIGII